MPLRLFCDTTDHYTCTAGRLTKQAGQGIIVFMRDQHLYRVAVNISWAQPDRFHNYGTTHWWNILPLELHWLCQITDGRKWYPVSCAFGGVDHMFTGNKCPQNVRALRPLVETVIQNTVHEGNGDVDMISCLESHARSS